MDSAPRGFTLWFTGWSGAGKTTVSRLVHARLQAAGVATELLDGDAVRREFCRDLGFSRSDRDENVRRLGYVAALLSRHGVVSIVAAISPYRAARDAVRQTSPRFVEIYVTCSLEVLLARDPKGLYARALRGEITGFTGINDPYEPPIAPHLTLDTATETPDQSAQRVWQILVQAGLLPADL